MKPLLFVKSVGAGNDFVVLDNRSGAVGRAAAASRHVLGSKDRVASVRRTQAGLSTLARRLCHRQLGIGADGLLLVERPDRGSGADFRLRIFNPDGSEPTMCVNGARCVALYAHAQRIAPRAMTFQTGAGPVRAQVTDQRVRLAIYQPKDWRVVPGVTVNGRRLTGYYLHTGVPHLVLFPSSLDRLDVARWGRLLRRSPRFRPGGVNVNFAAVRDAHHVRLRTYERGVEAETLACGSGAIATALAASRVRGARSPVAVQTTGRERLEVSWDGRDEAIRNVCLTGPTRLVYEGRIQV